VSILTQFIFRLSFGLALGMAATDPRKVTSGYYRNHLYVLLGLNVLATMVAFSEPEQFLRTPPLTAAMLSYFGSLIWLYEKPRAGRAALLAIAGVTLWGAWQFVAWPAGGSVFAFVLQLLDPLTSGLVLGFTIAAMFLGHWYLNTPTMAIGPLERLVLLMGAAVALRGVVEGAELGLAMSAGEWPSTQGWLFLALRWLAGIFGTLLLVVMTWKTLKIPNTQSATGILYVAVILTFLGELLSLLQHAETAKRPESGSAPQASARVESTTCLQCCGAMGRTSSEVPSTIPCGILATCCLGHPALGQADGRCPMSAAKAGQDFLARPGWEG